MFPAPDLENYDSDPDSYDDDEIFADIISKSLVHVPIRFDFDAAPDKHVDVEHPKSHLTLGQYPNCRIPVVAPVTPARFMKFILRNFYFVAFRKKNLETIDSKYRYDETLTIKERDITFLAG